MFLGYFLTFGSVFFATVVGSGYLRLWFFLYCIPVLSLHSWGPLIPGVWEGIVIFALCFYGMFATEIGPLDYLLLFVFRLRIIHHYRSKSPAPVANMFSVDSSS